MATGCCGVKKQKLNTAVVNGGKNGDRRLSSSSKGYLNRWSGAGGSSVDVRRMNEDCGESSSSHYSLRAMSLRPSTTGAAAGPRVVSVEMVLFCFDVLHSYLHSREPPKTPKFTNDQFPLFVTWKMGKDKKLRGCIGTFNSTSLHDGLREYAITSACKDSRFEPINPDEFARLHCSVSLLTDFEVADHYLDWEIGIHGIRIEFISEKGSKKAATYLPEVAIEQGWNQIQTIDSLLRKGGFKGTITPEIRGNVCLIRFQSEKMTVSYSEYVSRKQQQCCFVATAAAAVVKPTSPQVLLPPPMITNGQLLAATGSTNCTPERYQFPPQHKHHRHHHDPVAGPTTTTNGNGRPYDDHNHHNPAPSCWYRNNHDNTVVSNGHQPTNGSPSHPYTLSTTNLH